MLTLLLMALAAGPLSDSVDRGVSEALARERAAAFTAVRYDLAFTVPVSRQQPVEGTLRLAADPGGSAAHRHRFFGSKGAHP